MAQEERSGPARREDEVADQRRPEIQRPSGDERDLGSFDWVVWLYGGWCAAVRLVAYAFVGAGAGRRVDRGRLLWLGRGAKGEQFRRGHGAAAGGSGQTVISTGPYAVVRHPMYAYAVLLMIGAPLLLGSLWGLLGVVLLLPLLAARALGEEVMLLDGLPENTSSSLLHALEEES